MCLLSSPYFFIYAWYISPEAEVHTCFLAIIELPYGAAEAVKQAVITYLDHKCIPVARMVGFGSDSVSVMTGKQNGVGTRLKHRQPIVIGIHCVAHHLALAASQSGDAVPYISCTFKPTLKQLVFYFYENSPVQMSGLKYCKP